MANLKSSKKDVRRTAKKTATNKSTRTSLKTYVKKVREAIHTGDSSAIETTVTSAQKQLDKAVKKGIVHKNQAARRKSRIMRQAAKAAAGAPKVEKTEKVAAALKAEKPKAAAAKPETKAKPAAKKAEAKPAAKAPKAK